jgi:hypothetical protein
LPKKACSPMAILPACKDMGARAYVGVPVVVADGSFFGTLVGLDTGSKNQLPEHVEWLQVLARLAALEIQRQNTKDVCRQLRAWPEVSEVSVQRVADATGVAMTHRRLSPRPSRSRLRGSRIRDRGGAPAALPRMRVLGTSRLPD